MGALKIQTGVGLAFSDSPLMGWRGGAISCAHELAPPTSGYMYFSAPTGVTNLRNTLLEPQEWATHP